MALVDIVLLTMDGAMPWTEGEKSASRVVHGRLIELHRRVQTHPRKTSLFGELPAVRHFADIRNVRLPTNFNVPGGGEPVGCAARIRFLQKKVRDELGRPPSLFSSFVFLFRIFSLEALSRCI